MSTNYIDPAELFSRLLSHYGAEPDRRGWVHVTCPACGKEGSRKNIHFSFSLDHGARCLACGYGASLYQLAERAGLLDQPAAPAPVIHYEAPEPKHYAWMDELPTYLAKYEANPDRFLAWAEYRGLAPEIVAKYRLGLGAFPAYSSACTHERLMVPMLQAGLPVAFRGRALPGCEHKKWLSTAMGGRSPLLYNGAVLLAPTARSMAGQYDLTDAAGPWARGRVLVVVENPVDCLLLESAGLCCVATLGVTMWSAQRPWTMLAAMAKPKAVVVMYDHDLPGNGAANEREYQSMLQAWQREHNDQPAPLSNGLRLANELNAAGLHAMVWHWPAGAPVKADPGWMIETMGLERIAEIMR